MRYNELLTEYNHGNKMLAIRTALEKAGLTYVDYGSSALVMQARNGEIVKVFEPDPCYRKFLKLAQQMNNPHFPRIRKLVRFAKQPFRGNYLVKMEPLQKLSFEEYDAAIGFHCFVARHIQRSPYSLNLSFANSTDVPDQAAQAEQWAHENPEFAQAIRAIAKLPAGCRDDLHRNNIMKRGPTWVIIDPFASS